MDRAVIPCRGNSHARVRQLPRVSFALVTKHVVLVDHDERLGQARELVERSIERRRGRMFAGVGVRRVGVPEPFHGAPCQPGPIREAGVGSRVEPGIRNRVEQHLEADLRAAALLGHQGHRRGHVAPDAVARDCEAQWINAQAFAMVDHVAGRGVSLLDGDRIAGFRRSGVVDEHNRRLHAHRDLAEEAIVSVPIAHNPSAAMKIHYHRQRSDGSGRANDPHRHRPGGADREGDILDLRARLADRYRLRSNENRTCRVGRQGVDRRRIGQPIDELFSVGLQQRLGRVGRHEFSPVTSMLVRLACLLEGPRRGSGQDVGLPVEGGDQAVNTVILQDGGEFRASCRHLADRAVEINVGD